MSDLISRQDAIDAMAELQGRASSMEYGRCEFEEFDEAIKVVAWRRLPEPYREEGGM